MTGRTESRGALLPFIAALLAVAIACRRTIFGMLRYADYKFTDISPYNIAVLTPNYFDNGFIRRGLGGSIVYLIDGGTAAHGGSAAAIYQFFGAVMLALPMALLLRRLIARDDRLWRWFAVFMLVSPQLFWGWSRDPGRSDMLICGIIAWSLIAALGGRFFIPVLLLFIGSLIHETAIIYGGPMLVAMWFLTHRQGKVDLAHGISAYALLMVLLALAALARQHFGDDVTGIAATVRGARLVADNGRIFDIATYLTWSGFRSIGTSLCMAFSDRAVPWVIAACFVVLLVNCRVLFDRSLLVKCLLGFVALVPMIFMSAIAIDHGRWLMFAVSNAWLAVVAVRVMGIETAQPTVRDRRISGALLAALVLMGPTSAHFPSYLAEKLMPRLFTNNHPKWLQDCTPDWQATLGPPEAVPQH
ncbi:hypothetical protein EUV02_08290 [Polymorphobacter arshaanensis]|uniref:EpsG family protein n=1 Tax=Glacieibacterium arshaanense TaxID=2511025 RepID=A0A4Y9ENJ9_9SPHN|nr:hypothetical protein [Polymorphobacter arshaanensis]TFU03184.1 hypothetical protein EUV02_08290 [Polymorphobacter arshaanensis]